MVLGASLSWLQVDGVTAALRLGVLLEVNCETDFVARGAKFKELVQDMAMQAAASPSAIVVSAQEVPEEEMEKERQIEMGKEDIQNKPEAIRSVCLSLVLSLPPHVWLTVFARTPWSWFACNSLMVSCAWHAQRACWSPVMCMEYHACAWCSELAPTLMLMRFPSFIWLVGSSFLSLYWPFFCLSLGQLCCTWTAAEIEQSSFLFETYMHSCTGYTLSGIRWPAHHVTSMASCSVMAASPACARAEAEFGEQA